VTANCAKIAKIATDAFFRYTDGTFQTCATDGGNDGHRKNIMTAGSEVGCGTVFSGTNHCFYYAYQSDDGKYIYSTCDEGYGQVYTNQRILGG
jgi:hypothetical protein